MMHRRSRILAYLLASTVAATAVIAAPAPPADASDVSWGLRESFVRYILSSLSSGTIATTGSVQIDPDTEAFTFLPGEVTHPTATSATVSLPGSIHFTGHGEVLDSLVTDMRLEFSSPTQAAFVADYESNEMEGTTAEDYSDESVLTGNDVRIVELTFTTPVPLETLADDMTSASPTSYTATATLNDEGIPVFGAIYAGETYRKFEELTLTVGGTNPTVTPGSHSYEKPSTPDPDPDPNPSPDTPGTGSGSSTDSTTDANTSTEIKATGEEIVRIILGIISALAMLGMLATVIKHVAELGR